MSQGSLFFLALPGATILYLVIQDSGTQESQEKEAVATTTVSLGMVALDRSEILLCVTWHEY